MNHHHHLMMQQQYLQYNYARGAPAPAAAATDDGAPGPCCYFHPKESVIGVCATCLRERLLVLAAKQSGSGGHGSGRGVSGSCHLRPFSRGRRGGSRGKMISIHKVFALGLFLGGSRTEGRQRGRKKDQAAAVDDARAEESISSLEDSFISIKFGNDGKPSWDSTKKAAADGATTNPAPIKPIKLIPSYLLPPMTDGAYGNNHHQQEQQFPTADDGVDDQHSAHRLSVVEHSKSRSSSLRWRKRIAHLLHLIRWKRSAAGSSSKAVRPGSASGAESAVVPAVAVVPRRSGWMRSLTRRRSADRLV